MVTQNNLLQKPKKITIGFTPTEDANRDVKIDLDRLKKVSVTFVTQSKFENVQSFRQIINVTETPKNSK
jgi:hypothetical protein